MHGGYSGNLINQQPNSHKPAFLTFRLPTSFFQCIPDPLHPPVDTVDFITDTKRFKLLMTFAGVIKAVLFRWSENLCPLKPTALWLQTCVSIHKTIATCFFIMYEERHDAANAKYLHYYNCNWLRVKAAGDQKEEEKEL